jgi:multiple sugar transport system permease protein
VFFWQSLQAATLLVAVPIALVFAGFTMGAVKA